LAGFGHERTRDFVTKPEEFFYEIISKACTPFSQQKALNTTIIYMLLMYHYLTSQLRNYIAVLSLTNFWPVQTLTGQNILKTKVSEGLFSFLKIFQGKQ